MPPEILIFAWHHARVAKRNLMATVQTRYGRLSGQGWLVFSEDGQPSAGAGIDSSLTFPVDVLLLLASQNKQDHERALAELLWGYYMPGLLSPPRPPGDAEHEARTVRSLRRRVQVWRRQGTVDSFVRATKRATQGKFTAELAPHLERVRYGGTGGPDTVQDYLALVAWAIDQVMRAGKYELSRCELCRNPFLSRGRARYCLRLAPRDEILAAGPTLGAHYAWTSCQSVGKVKAYRARKRASRRDPEKREAARA